jgi:WXG100 family type VII secretion target
MNGWNHMVVTVGDLRRTSAVGYSIVSIRCGVVAMASTGRLRVDLEALASSAAHVTGQGEDLATAHLSSDNRIVAAQSGWVGSSALALSAKTAAWLETSRRLVTRVGDHAMELNNDGHSFAEMEQANVEKLQALHPAPEGLAGSA